MKVGAFLQGRVAGPSDVMRLDTGGRKVGGHVQGRRANAFDRATSLEDLVAAQPDDDKVDDRNFVVESLADEQLQRHRRCTYGFMTTPSRGSTRWIGGAQLRP